MRSGGPPSLDDASSRSSGAAVATLVLLGLDSLILAQGTLAYRDHFLTVAQLRAAQAPQGLPFLWHFGMWGDFFIVSPLAAYLAGRYAGLWRIRSCLLSVAIGLAAAALFSWLYTFSPTPEAHVRDHHLTAAGIVHLFYMAAAISVFVQFFLFTPGIARGLLGTVSILVLLHVFLGTHMALGLLGAAVRLDWYPGQPLKSVAGWLTIAVLAAGLLWRFAATFPRLSDLPRLATRRVVHLFMWAEGHILWKEEDVENPRGLLTFLDSAGSRVLEVGFFATAAWTVWGRFDCPPLMSDLAAALACLWSALLACLLVLTFGVVYFFSRHSAKVELLLVPMVFPAGRVPARWHSPRDPRGIILAVVCYFALYMALAWFAYDIRIVSFLMLVVASIDYNTRRLINKRVPGYFADAPLPDDRERGAIEERREVVRRHLLDRPHLRKEAGRIAGCAASFGIAMVGFWYPAGWMKSAAYLALIATLIVNEALTLRWRRDRDRGLLAIEARTAASLAPG